MRVLRLYSIPVSAPKLQSIIRLRRQASFFSLFSCFPCHQGLAIILLSRLLQSRLIPIPSHDMEWFEMGITSAFMQAEREESRQLLFNAGVKERNPRCLPCQQFAVFRPRSCVFRIKIFCEAFLKK